MNARMSLIALLVLATAGTGNAWADRGHHHRRHNQFGIYIGPYYGPWGYSPPVYHPPYYYPPVVVERSPPVVYVEQAPVAAAPPASTANPPPANDWYYCSASRAYYPYVRDCPQGWERVSPQPPGQP